MCFLFFLQYPAQVCRMAMLFYWTRECDAGITEIKVERKALQATLKKYSVTMSKMTTVLTRSQWRNSEEAMLPVHKNRLECMITVNIELVYFYAFQGTKDIMVSFRPAHQLL